MSESTSTESTSTESTSTESTSTLPANTGSPSAASPSDDVAPQAAASTSRSSSGSPTPRPLRDRRAVLRAAGVVALAGGGAAVLAACTPSQTATSPPSSAPSSEASSSEPSGSSESPTAESSSAEPSESKSSKAAKPSGPSAGTADVPVGSGVILPDADYVITQPTKGKFKAFTAICTHQHCKVSEMRSDKIHCGCHGSEFSISDGSVTNPPAREPLKEFKTAVSGSKVYVEE